MAFPTGTFTGKGANLDAYIPNVWGTKVNDFYPRPSSRWRRTLRTAPTSWQTVETRSTTPGLTEMAANSKSNATQVTLNSATETKQTLQVSNWYEVSFAIEDKEAASFKRSYTLQQAYMRNAAFTAAKKLEDAIATQFASITNSVGTTTVALTDANVRLAISKYETGNADFEEAVWFLHPKTVWVDLMAIDRFALALNAPGSNPVVKGAIGTIYGRPVVTSTRITTVNSAADYCGALANPDLVHFATLPLPGQRDAYGVRMQANYIPDFLSTLITCDILYGTVLNRAAAGCKIVSSV